MKKWLIVLGAVVIGSAGFALGAWVSSRFWLGRSASNALAQAGAEEVLIESSLRLLNKGDMDHLQTLLSAELDTQVLMICALLDDATTPGEHVPQARKILKRVAEYRRSNPSARSGTGDKDSSGALADEKRDACLKLALQTP